MIRDGLDAPPIYSRACERDCGSCPRVCRWAVRDTNLRAEGWQPISTAPIAKIDLSAWRGGRSFFVAPRWIEGLTTHNRIVTARYLADGRYGDHWSNDRGNVLYNLTHWRLIDGS